MSQTNFLNPGTKKPITQNVDELVGPASIARTTTVAASATAFQIDADGGLTNRRMVEIRVAGASDEVYVGFDNTVSPTNGMPVVQGAPLRLFLCEFVPIWVSGAGTVTLYEEARG